MCHYFLSHFYWVQNIQNILYKLGYSESLRPKLLGIIMSFVTALGVMICGDFLKNIVGKKTRISRKTEMTIRSNKISDE